MPGLTSFGNSPDAVVSPSPQSHDRGGSESPAAPPYSPISPVIPPATVAPAPLSYSEYSPPAMERPTPTPVSGADNPDAIALRSAIAVLQIQRQRTVRDLKTLERQKAMATADPEKFAQDLTSGRIVASSSLGIFSGPAVDLSRELPGESDESTATAKKTGFGVIPAPQDVVRTPPINWTKYHVVGEALDRLHEEQRSRPTSGEPERGVDSARSSEHVIAAPYQPWTDHLSNTPARSGDTAKHGL